MKHNIFTKGFTLIEVIVSISIFTIIMVMGMGALINVNNSNKESKSQKDAMDTLNFALESMTRDVRTGTNIFCNVSTSSPQTQINERQDCDQSGSTLGFLASGTRGYYMYYQENGSLFRIRILDPVGDPTNQETPEELISSDRVVVTGLDFRVVGADDADSGDTAQPYVLVRMTAHTTTNVDDEFLVQTLVSIRSLDA